MSRIELTPEQVSAFANAMQVVELCDASGVVIGTAMSLKVREMVERHKSRMASSEPWYTSEQVSEMMRTLESVREKEGSLTRERKDEILKTLKAKWSK
ncbi:MAG: hypothetical protein K2X38_01110 [Gemmataceae bacterium]|nr:hypothetical protein [Gemmataceae bacterium]